MPVFATIGRGAVALLLTATMLMPMPVRADPAETDGLSRLAGTLGAVHYLRTLCNPDDGQRWRDEMLEMLEAADLSQKQRDKLIAAFNAGYSRQQAAHRACTPAAANLGNTYVRQGAQDARALARRLGG